MTLPTSKMAYLDCYEILDKALEYTEGVRLKCTSESSAYYLRNRINQARRIEREDNKQIYNDPGHPMHGRSPYDSLIVKVKKIDDIAYIYVEQGLVAKNLEPLGEKIEPVEQTADQPVQLKTSLRR